MRWCNTILAGALAIMLLADWAFAQPPRGQDQQGGGGEARGQRQDLGPPRKPEGRGPGEGRGVGEGRARNPVILALDTDADGELSAAEIANAAAALRAGGLPKGLNILGLWVGAVGILSLIPGLTDLLTGVFGLSQIIWFVWLGIVLLRRTLLPDR